MRVRTRQWRSGYRLGSLPSLIDVVDLAWRERLFEVIAPSQAGPGGRDEHELGLPQAAAEHNFAAPVQPEIGPGARKTCEVPASALLAQLVEHFHGKEGVVGSSPTEGSR
jgi:hypothetical protein